MCHFLLSGGARTTSDEMEKLTRSEAERRIAGIDRLRTDYVRYVLSR